MIRSPNRLTNFQILYQLRGCDENQVENILFAGRLKYQLVKKVVRNDSAESRRQTVRTRRWWGGPDNLRKIEVKIVRVHEGGFRKNAWHKWPHFYLKSAYWHVCKIYAKEKKRNLVFSCFIDFRNAFDLTPRQKLFDKLRRGGIRGLS